MGNASGKEGEENGHVAAGAAAGVAGSAGAAARAPPPLMPPDAVMRELPPPGALRLHAAEFSKIHPVLINLKWQLTLLQAFNCRSALFTPDSETAHEFRRRVIVITWFLVGLAYNSQSVESLKDSMFPYLPLISHVPVAPLHIPTEFSPVFNNSWINESDESTNNHPQEKGIPTLISWSQGGNEVFVEGSWDNWTSRRVLEKSGKDHTILLVLPSGVYHYRIIVDGEPKYVPELPHVADEGGQVANLLDVHDYIPESLGSVAGFDSPPSPEHSYDLQLPGDEEFAKEPPILPPQLVMSVLGDTDNSEEQTLKPKHVVLNHLYIEKGWGSQSLLALGVTHRFQSKYYFIEICDSTKMRYKYPVPWLVVTARPDRIAAEAQVYEASPRRRRRTSAAAAAGDKFSCHLLKIGAIVSTRLEPAKAQPSPADQRTDILPMPKLTQVTETAGWMATRAFEDLLNLLAAAYEGHIEL
ncbi:hypothetical protein OsJ_19026 [Oryza sativa Japonica Group]|uniref:Association with the SNF1 complex (ASC) domain-containing protein n=1 Tax=Oryza sativa subsp. japonica TaxID=39947 RepID=B9FK60_ORYSJ|nr:hypothetical protein OsJ_19026 [Oryza sativa Japonica Group]